MTKTRVQLEKLSRYQRNPVLTDKKLVSFTIQKNSTVPNAKYPPKTTPVANISLSFQLSGTGDGFTRSFEIVIMVPGRRVQRVNTRAVSLEEVIMMQVVELMNSPSFSMAMISTMNGAKSNFHISAISMNPNYRRKESFNFI